MNIKLLRSFIRESLGREIMSDPQSLAGQDTAAQIQRELTKVKTIDKSKLPVEEVLKELILAAGPNTYIRYQNKFDDGDAAPDLEVSPNVQFQTPHGIYGYPLDQNNLLSLVTNGKPTNADFAVSHMFFHVYKIDTSRTVNVAADSNKKNIVQGRYSKKRKVIDDIAECVRLSIGLVRQNRSELADERVYENFEQDIKKLDVIEYGKGIEVDEFYEKYCHFVKEVGDNTQSIFEIYKFEIAESIYERERKRISVYSDASKQYLYFRILKCAIDMISLAVSRINNTSKGQYFSLLLKSVGISGITDQETGTIHASEPSQSVSFDFSGNTIQPVGTYRNIFKTTFEIEEEKGKYKDKFENILEDLISKNLVKWDVPRSSVVSNYDYENLVLKSFKSVVNYIKQDEFKLFSFVSAVAEKSVHTDVINYIYKNYRDFEIVTRIPAFYYLLRNNTTKINPSYMISYYKEFIRPKLNCLYKQDVMLSLTDKEFVSSHSLPKPVMLDIIKNTKGEGFRYESGNFRQDPLIEQLSMSAVLDEDVCNKMIKKFGIKNLEFLSVNKNAPVTKTLINKIKNLLDGEDLIQKNEEEVAKIFEKVSTCFDNSHLSREEYLYLCSICSEVFKSHYRSNYTTGFSSLKYYVEGSMRGLIYSDKFDSQTLKSMNITLEEEVNILRSCIEGYWESEYEENQEWDEYEEKTVSFDLVKDGVPYLDVFYNGEKIKRKLSRAYKFLASK